MQVLERLAWLLLTLMPSDIYSTPEDAFYNDFPDHVPVFPHRLDPQTRQPVARGLFGLMGGFKDLAPSVKMSVSEFRKRLQCAAGEPDIIGDRGTAFLMKMVPITKTTVRLMSMWALTKCEPWLSCHKMLADYDEGKMTLRDESPYNLLRIINSTLFYDWPFGRLKETADKLRIGTMRAVLMKVNISDAVFFLGQEAGNFPADFPFYAITNSGSYETGDIPWPWNQHFLHELTLFNRFMKSGSAHGIAEISHFIDKHNNISEELWHKRIEKATFYGYNSVKRNVFFHVARNNSHLFSVGWTNVANNHAWNPNSREPNFPYGQHTVNTSFPDLPGYLRYLNDTKVHTPVDAMGFENLPYEKRNKYIIVLVGGVGTASSDRLSHMMLMSGAVILLQKHAYQYFYSSRLIPWVHYVPISYSTTDAVDKIKWLKENDDKARQLALNARTFALSHLRLEDILCYAASALEHISSTEKADTSALEPFSEYEISDKDILFHIL